MTSGVAGSRGPVVGPRPSVSVCVSGLCFPVCSPPSNGPLGSGVCEKLRLGPSGILKLTRLTCTHHPCWVVLLGGLTCSEHQAQTPCPTLELRTLRLSRSVSGEHPTGSTWGVGRGLGCTLGLHWLCGQKVILPPWEGIWHRLMASLPLSQSSHLPECHLYFRYMDEVKMASITLLLVVYCLLKPQTRSSRSLASAWGCVSLHRACK